MDEAIKGLFFDACSNAMKWGPGLLIALFMLYGAYKLLLRLGRDVGMRIADAIEKPTAALTVQANSMDRLTTSIREYVGRDANEHQEIIILQKVIRQEIRETKQQTDEYMKKMKEQSERMEKYLKESADGRS
jgi:hypothetical protein